MSHTHIFLPQPPRAKGSAEQSAREYQDWSWRFFQALAIDNRVLIASDQYRDPGTLDPDNLPAPTDDEETTISTAQQTANAAHLLATLLFDGIRAGAVTVSGAATTGVATFASELVDASYRVCLTRSAFTGAPAAGSDLSASIAKTATGFTLTVQVAPGVGNSVTFDYIVIR